MSNTNPGDPRDRTNYTGSNPDETPNVQPNRESYGSGYVHGQTVERQRYETTQQTRDENNSATGFLIGILLTGLVLGGAALAYFATQRNQAPAQRTIVVPSAAPSPSPQVRERVIERDRIVPVPQPQQSSPTIIPAPTVRIEAPKPAPAPQTAPAAPSSPRNDSPTSAPPRSAEPSPAPEGTASPNSNGSGQSNNSGQ